MTDEILNTMRHHPLKTGQTRFGPRTEASLAATHALEKDFTEALWNAPVPSAFGERYNDGLLYMMSLLHCSGQFRIWKL